MNFSDFYQSNYFYIIYCVSFFYIIYKLTTRRFTLAKEIGIRGPTPIPLFGNIFDYIKHGFLVCDVENQKKYGDIYPVYMGQVAEIMVSDESIIKQIFLKDSKSFADRQVIQGLSRIMKKNLAVLKGKDWERVRALLTPIFTSGKLRRMSPMIISCVNDMMERFVKAETVPVEIKELFKSLTMDVICRTMFGIEINVSENNSHPIISHVKKLFALSTSGVLFTFISVFPQVGELVDYFFPNGFISPRSELYLIDTLRKTIAARRQGTTEYHDFLALMMKTHDELSQENQNPEGKSNNTCYAKLTEEEIMAQALIFMFAGYETTAGLLTFCTYYLSKNSDVQEELYEELIQRLGNEKEITCDMLGDLNLLDQCINETLRISSPIIRLGRTCTKDAEVTTSTGQIIAIKKGMEIIVPTYAVHHDKRLWPNPEKFDIHRFDKDERQGRSALSFIPFGIGPRNCIGLRFALLEAKLALANIIKNYIILPCDQTIKVNCFDTTTVIRIKDPVFIKVKKR